MRKAIILLLFLFLVGCTYSPSAETETSYTDTAEITEVISTIQTTAPTDPMADFVSNLSVEEKVGQLFLARCPETGALEDISQYHLGGFLLFARDFSNQSPETVKDTIATYQKASSIPMLIAVDEEGGTVCRVSTNPQFRSSRFSSLRKLYSTGGINAIILEETEKCQLLASLGINVNMAPVCDITTDPDAFMFKRSLGQNPETTALCISEITKIMHENRIGSVLKHFPGYGNNKDTHTDTVTDSKPLSQLEENDLLPFSAGIKAGCDAILISHSIITALDDQLPASLSPKVISYLRNTMQFDGVIITDDLVMKAITQKYTAGEAAVLAILAGNDLLCASEYQIQYSAILDAVTSERISMEMLDAAVYRILRWKVNLGLLSV